MKFIHTLLPTPLKVTWLFVVVFFWWYNYYASRTLPPTIVSAPFYSHIILTASAHASLCHRTPNGPRLKTLVSELAGRVPQLHLWAAGVFHLNIPPELQAEVLTTPLRSAPVVLREMQPTVYKLAGGVHNYIDSGLPAPGDGLTVVKLSHHGNAHTGPSPVDCVRCGKDVAAELRRLGVGSESECI